MDILSEEEQWEALKRWFRQNGGFLVGVIVLSLLAVGGWRWWQSHTVGQAEAASNAYDTILQTFDAGKVEEALTQVEALRKDHPKSGYVLLADLAAVRVQVSRDELDKAEARLKQILSRPIDTQVKSLVELRLARVQSALGRHDQALATLGTADRGAHQSAFAEVRGDVTLVKGDKAGALREYEAARKILTAEDVAAGINEMLDLKISDLKAELPVAAATSPAPAASAPVVPAASAPVAPASAAASTK